MPQRKSQPSSPILADLPEKPARFDDGMRVSQPLAKTEVVPRGKDGTFQRGHPGGPGNPLAAKLIPIRQIWLDAVRQKFTPEVACGVFDKLVDIALHSENDRASVMAAGELLSRIGIHKIDGDEKPEGGITLIIGYQPIAAPVQPAAKPVETTITDTSIIPATSAPGQTASQAIPQDSPEKSPE